VVYEPKTPLMNLFGSLLQAAGAKTEQYPQVIGRLERI
jgi:hypothetical protein